MTPPSSSHEPKRAQLFADARTPPTIPDYVTIRCIGQGSYGDVWLARNVVGTHFAAKIVYRDRFEQERPYEREFSGIKNFEPISRSHPGLMAILHVGRNDAERFFYYVMELADDARKSGPALERTEGTPRDLPQVEPASKARMDDGQLKCPSPEQDLARSYVPQTLAAVMQKRGSLPVSECVQLGIVVAEALEHLHQHGLVHRDIKPSNIIFVGGRPKLADIGLVTTPGDDHSLVGTPGFIAPEGSGTVGADLYGLGKVLYELSTGKDRHRFPEPPSRIEGAGSREEWAELNEFLLRACENNPARRYGSAKEMASELSLVASGRSLRRLHKLERRVKRLGRIGLAAALVMALGTVALLYQQHQSRRYSDLSDQLRHELSGSHVANGVRLVDEGDLLSSLPWFVEAMRLDLGDTSRELMHRRRIESILENCPRLVALGAHAGWILYAEFSPDGRRVVTASADGTGRVWDAETGEPITPPLRHEDEVEMAVFSPDGKRVVTASHDHTGQIWDADDGVPVGPPLRHAAELSHVAVSSDSARVVTASRDGTAQLWDAKTGHPIGPRMQHGERVVMVTFSPDGRWVATASHDMTARVWDATNGEPVSPPLQHPARARHAAFSPNGKLLATSASGGGARLWNTETWQPRLLPASHTGPCRYVTFSSRGDCLASSGGEMGSSSTSGELMLWRLPEMTLMAPPVRFAKPAQEILFSPDGRWVICASSDATVRRLAADSGVLLGAIIRQQDTIRNVQLASDGRRILTSGHDGIWRVWDLASKFSTDLTLHFTNTSLHAEFSPDGRRILTATRSAGAMVWDAATGETMTPALRRAGPCLTGQFSPDGHWIALAQTGGVVRVWNWTNAEPVSLAVKHSAEINALSFSADSRFLASGSVDGTVQVWEATRPKLIFRPLAHSDPVLVLAFSPDGRRLAVGCGDLKKTGVGQAKLWSIDRTTPVGQSLGGNGTVGDLFFSPDGRWLVTSCFVGAQKPGYAQMWDADTGRPVGPPFRQEEGAGPIEFSPDGRLLATSGIEGTVCLWDVATSRPATRRLRHKRGITALSFSPDGTRIATGDAEGSIRLWDTLTGEPLGPSLKCAGFVQRTRFSPDGRRLLTVSGDGGKGYSRVQVVDLTLPARSFLQLQQIAALWSGARFDPESGLTSLPREEALSLWRRLRVDQPEQVTTSTKAAQLWHEQQAFECEQVGNWLGAAFHLRQVLGFRPRDSATAARLRRAEGQLQTARSGP